MIKMCSHKYPILLLIVTFSGRGDILSVVYDTPTVSPADDPTVVKINAFTDKMVDYANPRNFSWNFSYG